VVERGWSSGGMVCDIAMSRDASWCRRCRPGGTGSRNGFLFSVPLESEGFRQLEGGFVQRQVMDRSPEIENVAVGTAVGVKTLEEIRTQVSRKGALRVRGLTVDGAAAAALLATPTQVAHQSQMFENLLHGYLLTQEREVNLDTLRGWRPGGHGRDRRRVDRRWCRRYGGGSRGDHC